MTGTEHLDPASLIGMYVHQSGLEEAWRALAEQPGVKKDARKDRRRRQREHRAHLDALAKRPGFHALMVEQGSLALGAVLRGDGGEMAQVGQEPGIFFPINNRALAKTAVAFLGMHGTKSQADRNFLETAANNTAALEVPGLSFRLLQPDISLSNPVS